MTTNICIALIHTLMLTQPLTLIYTETKGKLHSSKHIVPLQVMDILLFDHHSGGHHVEYASRLSAELEASEAETEITFLSPADFSTGRERTIDVPTVSLNTSPQKAGDGYVDVISEALSYADTYDAEVLHFLQIDDIVSDLITATTGQSITVPLVASINGSFFRNSSIGHRVIDILELPTLGSGIRSLYHTVPELFHRYIHSLPKRYLAFMTASDVHLFSHVLVHTEEARKFVNRVTSGTIPVSVVPDPVDLWFQESSGQLEARTELGISGNNPVFLYFGELRDDKGIDVLLEALKDYDGPRFTIVIAGSAEESYQNKLCEIRSNECVSLHEVIKFIPDTNVPLYFQATDAVLLPYRRMFGEERTSNVFQKACASCRPVIAPDFGALGRRTREYKLGVVFDPEDAGHLAEVLAQAATDGVGFDKETMERYISTQTYSQLAEQVLDVYRDLATGYVE